MTNISFICTFSHNNEPFGHRKGGKAFLLKFDAPLVSSGGMFTADQPLRDKGAALA